MNGQNCPVVTASQHEIQIILDMLEIINFKWVGGGAFAYPFLGIFLTSFMDDPSQVKSQESKTKREKRGLTSSLFIGSSLPIRSQAGSPAPGGQNPNSGQRSRNSSGTGSCAGGRTSAQR